MSINQIYISGHLGKDPEFVETETSTVCNFSIAIDDSYTDKNGEKHEGVIWSKVTAWGPLGKICHEKLKKGQKAWVTGRIKVEEYEDQHGQNKKNFFVLANKVEF